MPRTPEPLVPPLHLRIAWGAAALLQLGREVRRNVLANREDRRRGQW